MDRTEISALLDHDRAEWEALVAALEAYPDVSLHDPASPTWTSRDVYAHLARWMAVSTSHLESEMAGRLHQQIEGSDDEINARWQTEDSALSLDDARACPGGVPSKNRGHPVGARRPMGRCAGQDRPRGRSGALRGPPQLYRGRATLNAATRHPCQPQSE